MKTKKKKKEKKKARLFIYQYYLSNIYKTGLQHVFFSHGAPIINQAIFIACLLSRKLTRRA
jgi:hypothetical protein